MITTKEIKIKIPDNFTSKYIENELKKLKSDILHWAVIDYDEDYYTLNISIVE